MRCVSKIPLCRPSTYEMLYKMDKRYNSLPVPKPCNLPLHPFFFCLSFPSEAGACPSLKFPCCTTAGHESLSRAVQGRHPLGEHHRPGWFYPLWPQPSQTPGPSICPVESPHEPGAEQTPERIPGLVPARLRLRGPTTGRFVARLLRCEPRKTFHLPGVLQY